MLIFFVYNLCFFVVIYFFIIYFFNYYYNITCTQGVGLNWLFALTSNLSSNYSNANFFFFFFLLHCAM